MTETPDLLTARLIRAYLEHAGSAAAGVPDNIALPKLVMDDGSVPPRPSVVVAAREEKGSAGPRRVVVVNVMLLTWLRAETGAASVTEQTTRATASAWLAALDQRLRDRAALSAWLAALTEEQRTGWTITKIVYEGAAAPLRNADIHTVNYALTLRLTLFVNPT